MKQQRRSLFINAQKKKKSPQNETASPFGRDAGVLQPTGRPALTARLQGPLRCPLVARNTRRREAAAANILSFEIICQM